MTLIGVVIVMGLLGFVLLRGRTLRAGCFVYAAIWGLLVGATPVGPAVRSLLNQLGAAAWKAVQQL
jgi:hypothetical protein